MDDQDKPSWFKHLVSGQVFEAEGNQAALARKDRDIVPLDGPPDNADETDPALAALRTQLTALAIPYSDNATPQQLQTLLGTEVTAWRAKLERAGQKITANWKPETLKAKADEIK